MFVGSRWVCGLHGTQQTRFVYECWVIWNDRPAVCLPPLAERVITPAATYNTSVVALPLCPGKEKYCAQQASLGTLAPTPWWNRDLSGDQLNQHGGNSSHKSLKVTHIHFYEKSNSPGLTAMYVIMTFQFQFIILYIVIHSHIYIYIVLDILHLGIWHYYSKEFS